MRTVAGRGLLDLSVRAAASCGLPDADVGQLGDRRQRLTTFLHARDRRAGLGPVRGHSLAASASHLLAQLRPIAPSSRRRLRRSCRPRTGSSSRRRCSPYPAQRALRWRAGSLPRPSPGFQLGRSCCCHDRDTKTDRAGRATTTATFATHQFFRRRPYRTTAPPLTNRAPRPLTTAAPPTQLTPSQAPSTAHTKDHTPLA